MFKTALIAAGVLLAATAASVPAQASGVSFSFGISSGQGGFHIGTPGHARPHHHWRGHRHQALSPRAIAQRLHGQGFRRVGQLQRRGHVYTARAQQRRGQWVIVQANAYTGQVMSVRRIR
jgi:hypothetical protein